MVIPFFFREAVLTQAGLTLVTDSSLFLQVTDFQQVEERERNPLCVRSASQACPREGRVQFHFIISLPLSPSLIVLTSLQSSVSKWKSTWAHSHTCAHRCHPLPVLRAGLTLQVPPSSGSVSLPELSGQLCQPCRVWS